MLIGSSTWEVETGGWQVQGQPEPYSKIQSQLLSHLCPTYYFDLTSIVASSRRHAQHPHKICLTILLNLVSLQGE